MTTKSIDAKHESLDGEKSLSKRLGGSTVNKSSFFLVVCERSYVIQEQESKAKSERWRQRRHQKQLRLEAAARCNSIEPQVCNKGGEQGSHLLLRVHVGKSKRHDS